MRGRKKVFAGMLCKLTVAAHGQEPVRVSGGIVAGMILHKVQPAFPREACEARVNGAVVMAIVIGMDGTVQEVNAISGPQMLRVAYADAVWQWRYRPYLVNGQAVPVRTTVGITMNFGGDCSGLR